MSRADLPRFTAVALLVMYAGLAIVMPPGAFFTGEEGIAWLQTRSIGHSLWTSLSVPNPGGDLDPEGEFLPELLAPVGGGLARARSSSALALVSSIPWAVAGGRAMALVPMLSMALCLFASVRLAGRIIPEAADPRGAWAGMAGAACVVATPLIFYGAIPLGYAPAAALVTMAALPLLRALEDGAATSAWSRAFTGGLLLGAAAWFRPEAGFIVPSFLAAAILARGARAAMRVVPGVAVGLGLFLAPMALHARLTTGSWLPFGTSDPASPSASMFSPLEAAAGALLPSGARPVLALLVMAVCVCTVPAVRRSLAGRRVARWLPVTGAAMAALLLAAGPGATAATALSGQPLLAQSGVPGSLAATMPLVALAPILLLIPGASPGWQARLMAWTAALFTVMALAMGNLGRPVAGELQWGPRLLLPVAPMMVIAIVASVAAGARRQGGRLAVAGLCAALVLGVTVQGMGLRFLVAVKSAHAALVQRVEREVPEGDAILTDLPAVAPLLAPLSATRSLLYVRPGSDLEQVMERLDATGAGSFWLVRDTLSAGQLKIVPAGREAGVRGFMRLPAGD